MSWEDQGRQEHGWFGSGKAPEKPKEAPDARDRLGQTTLAQRAQAVAYGAIGALPPSFRARAESLYQAGSLSRLTEVLTAWSQATKLDLKSFASRFFDREAGDPIVEKLHSAALSISLAAAHSDLRAASEKLAEAMQAVGLDRWPRFLADAQERARDPATIAAVEKSIRPPQPGGETIQPVYPIETALGIVAGGLAARAAVRTGVAVIAKQLLPDRNQATSIGVGAGGGSAKADSGLPTGETPERSVQPERPLLPANPDDLISQGWREISHPKAVAKGHRTFMNPKTSQIIEFDRAKPELPGWRGRDHYHVPNPNSIGKHDMYLDETGRPVRDGSNRSHLRPGSQLPPTQ